MPALRHPSEWVIEPLGNHHNRADFLCGNASLDRYLKEQAGQDLRRACAIPFVLAPRRGDPSILGYYTLSSYGVDIGELPVEVAKRLPRYPLIPATLLGRLAVDRRHQGQGIGEFLLMDALHRALVQSAVVAAAVVVVDAIDAGAAEFYRHFGFVAFPSIAGRLFLPMKAAAGLFP
ncbi:MAG: GNAT family N-acetyltransferase [Acidobacteriia bacterium]|nr:GNAT family N-acetyltransferase [Terriglobia bacterium]